MQGRHRRGRTNCRGQPYRGRLRATGVRRPQAVQVRVTPDIDIHEHAVERILDQPLLYLVDLQCQIGSQVTDASLYGDAIRQMVPLMAEARPVTG